MIRRGIIEIINKLFGLNSKNIEFEDSDIIIEKMSLLLRTIPMEEPPLELKERILAELKQKSEKEKNRSRIKKYFNFNKI